MAAPTTTVPFRRIGALLQRQRVERGEDLEFLVGRSFGSFSVSDLAAIEAGRRSLEPDLLDAVIDLYRLDRDLIRDESSTLVLDLAAEQMQVGPWQVSFSSSSVDDILDSYLDMVRSIRGLDTAEPFTLRNNDLVILGDALAVDPDGVRDRLVARFDTPEAGTSRFERLRVAAGLTTLVAVAASGALVLVQAPWKPVSVPATGAATAELAVPQTVAQPALAGAALVSLPVGEVVDASTAPASDVGGVDSAVTSRQRLIEASIPWDFRAALPDWTIGYTGTHVDWWGVTNSVERTVTLFDRPGTSVEEAAAVLVHELGHALDLDRLDDAQRVEWMQMRGMPMVWWADNGSADFSVGAGDFAEAVAASVLGAPSRSAYGEFSDVELAFVERVLAG